MATPYLRLNRLRKSITNMMESSLHIFFLRLLLLEEVFRSHTKDKHYIRVLFTKGDWKLLLSRFFFCSVLPFFATLNFETYGD